MEITIKSKETKEGVRFRIIKDGKFLFPHFNFNNYFYVKRSDYETHEEDFIREFNFCIAKCEVVGQFVKISLSNNFMRNKVRQFWEALCHTYEADILTNKRFLLDNKITLNNTHIPYTFYDIETDDRLPLVKDDRGNVIPGDAKILSYASTNQEGEQVFYILKEYTDEAEKELLKLIIEDFSKYGVISGWNSIPYDMLYIKGRCDALGVNYAITDFINHLDYLELFKKYDKKSRGSFSLNNISNEVLNESKVDQKKGNGAIYNTWLTNKEHLEKYNREDTNLIYKINKKMMFIEVSMKRADNAGCHVQNTVKNSDSGDYLLMRKYKEHNIIMPSQPTKEEVEKRKGEGPIGGGYTTCLRPGFHEDVDVCDFKSEYPSVIQTWNISPETYVETIHDEKAAMAIDRTKFIVTPHDFEGIYHPARVYRKEEGIIPKVVRWIVEERDKIKYPMKQYKDTDPEKYRQLYLLQYALKTDGNSIYGILAFPLSRYYSWELGDSVTTCARATLKECNKQAISWGVTVLGGDTDSTFFKRPEHLALEQMNENFRAFLKTWADKYGCVVNKLEFEYEKTFEKMLFVKKKHYAYKIKDEITIKGLEAIKADTNKAAATLQKQFIVEILNSTYDAAKWEKFITDLYQRVYNQELTVDELKLVKALSKMPKDYVGTVTDSKTGEAKIKADGSTQMKAIPAHVKLAERMISQGIDLYSGSKIPYIVIKDKPILAVSPEEFEKGSGVFNYKHKKYGFIDYEWEGGYEAKYYWERILKPLIKVVFTYYGRLPEWDWNLTKSQYTKIMKNLDREDDDDCNATARNM